MSRRPEEVELSREEGEELIDRLKTDRVTAADREVLVKLIRLYFWLSFALQETKISLKRLKVALFGEGRINRTTFAHWKVIENIRFHCQA